MQIPSLAQGLRGPFSDRAVSEELVVRGYRLETDPLYCLLQELKQEELLRSEVKAVDGRRARIYEITALGRRVLRSTRREVEKLHHELRDSLPVGN
jgi:DNA-binding PadR family transcriptional regulator